MNNPEKNRKLGERVRCLREQGLTFSQISQELKQPLSTCYSAMKSLKLSKNYTETLKMIVKKSKRNYAGSLHSENERESEGHLITTDHSPALPVAITSFTDTKTVPFFVPYQEINSETASFLEETKRIASPAPFKGNDEIKVTVMEENAEKAITQKLTWALEQLENSKKPDEIVQLMNVVASALSILNSLKVKENSTP